MTKNIQCSLIVSLMCLVSACSSTSGAGKSSPGVQPAPDAVQPMATQRSDPLSKEDLAALRDPKNPLSKRSIYFDLDSNVIKPEYRQTLETHGAFIAKRSAVKIAVQGNTDERGSREYNVALGQRRADVVKIALQTQGAKNEQIEAVSFGSEKPSAQGHSESAWERNRRVDIVYPGE